MTQNSLPDTSALEQFSTEIRGAVNALLGLTDLLLDTPLDDTQREYIDVLRSTADRLLTIGGDAASLSGRRARAQSFVNVDLRETLVQVADLARALPAQRSLTVITNFDGALDPPLLGDRLYIEQALMALVKACTSAPSIESLHISASQPAPGSAHLRVRAISQENPGSLVEEMRVRVRSTERHVDELRVQERPDGLVLSFAAPVRSCAETANEPATGKSRHRVLLVEDAADNQFIVRAFLRNEPYELEVVNCGADAVERIRSTSYDIVLMDLEMPGMDGIEATAAIREWERANNLPGMPVVALTARSGSEEAALCLSHGFSGFLSKPVSKSGLLSTLRSYFVTVQ